MSGTESIDYERLKVALVSGLQSRSDRLPSTPMLFTEHQFTKLGTFAPTRVQSESDCQRRRHCCRQRGRPPGQIQAELVALLGSIRDRRSKGPTAVR